MNRHTIFRFNAVLGVILAVFLILILPLHGSSHREAPIIAQDPLADLTDVYFFVSPDQPNTVTIIIDVIPFEEPAGGPNFYRFDDNVLYAINIDNDGDARPEIVYEFRFTSQVQDPNTFLYNVGPITSLTDPNWNVRQVYSVTRVDSTTGESVVLGTDLPTPPVNIGPASIPDYDALASAAINDLGDSVMVFAGQRDDPFYVDLGAVFDLLTIRPGAPGNNGGGVDGLGGFNCHSIVLQVPKTDITADGSNPGDPADPNAVVGVWATTSRTAMIVINPDGSRTHSGDWVQVARLGLPLVNEVVIPMGNKDLFNASHPVDDGQFAGYVLDPEVGVLLNLLYGLSVPAAPRNDLLVLLTGIPGLNQPPAVQASDMLRLNVAIPSALPGDPDFSIFGVIGGDLSGYPNGRRLYDDVVAISLRAMAGVLVDSFNIFPNNALDDGVHFNDAEFAATFPYVAAPWQGFEHSHHLVSPPPVGIIDEEPSSGTPQDFGLFQNYPNPFNPATSIKYRIPRAQKVRLTVYNLLGQEVRTLLNEKLQAGVHLAQWDGRDNSGRSVASGTYIYRLETEDFLQARKMVLVK